MITLMRALALTGGEWVIYILLVCSVLAVAIILERLIVLSREKKAAQNARKLFLNAVQSKDISWQDLARQFKNNRDFVSQVLASTLVYWSQGAFSAEEHFESAQITHKKTLEQRLTILGTLGNNAVYIGLFGTVLGVIKAFKDLGGAQGAGPEIVMQGLSEALIATAVGLMVALPCTAAYNFFQKEIKDLSGDAESLARTFLAHLKAK